MKNPVIAAILNIIPGLGYIYVGGKRKLFGWLLFGGMVIGIIGTFDPSLNLYSEENMSAGLNVWTWLAFAGSLLTIVAFVNDAYMSALEHNKGAGKKKKSK